MLAYGGVAVPVRFICRKIHSENNYVTRMYIVGRISIFNATEIAAYPRVCAGKEKGRCNDGHLQK